MSETSKTGRPATRKEILANVTSWRVEQGLEQAPSKPRSHVPRKINTVAQAMQRGGSR